MAAFDDGDGHTVRGPITITPLAATAVEDDAVGLTTGAAGSGSSKSATVGRSSATAAAAGTAGGGAVLLIQPSWPLSLLSQSPGVRYVLACDRDC